MVGREEMEGMVAMVVMPMEGMAATVVMVDMMVTGAIIAPPMEEPAMVMGIIVGTHHLHMGKHHLHMGKHHMEVVVTEVVDINLYN
ncbi:hypothetical protein EJD04_27760 [Salmonella enterica]|nr:hypothetical protein [Salmonella enterica]